MNELYQQMNIDNKVFTFSFLMCSVVSGMFLVSTLGG